MKKYISLGLITIMLFLGLFLAVRSMTTAVSINPDTMAAANNLYAAGHFGEAKQLYEQMVAQGAEDAALFYNLGNATYQLGDHEEAGIYYARATELAPRDADIQANFALVGGAPMAQSPVQDVLGWLTLNETAVLTITLWFVFGVALLAIVLLESGRGRTAATAVAVLSFAVLMAAGALLGTHMMVLPSGLSGAVAL